MLWMDNKGIKFGGFKLQEKLWWTRWIWFATSRPLMTLLFSESHYVCFLFREIDKPGPCSFQLDWLQPGVKRRDLWGVRLKTQWFVSIFSCFCHLCHGLDSTMCRLFASRISKWCSIFIDFPHSSSWEFVSPEANQRVQRGASFWILSSAETSKLTIVDIPAASPLRSELVEGKVESEAPRQNLVGGLLAISFLFSHIYIHILGISHHPNWRSLIFFRGLARNHQPENDEEWWRMMIQATSWRCPMVSSC